MKKQNVKSLLFAVCVLVLAVACKFFGSGAEYSSATDKFSIAFPNGRNDVETKTDKSNYSKSVRTYSKSFDNRSDNFRIYIVQVADIDSSQVAGKSSREILEIGLNGWEKEAETKIKDITVNGQNGIDSLRTILGLSFREVIFWSDTDKKLYVLTVAAKKKDITTAPEAEKFVKSFKLNA